MKIFAPIRFMGARNPGCPKMKSNFILSLLLALGLGGVLHSSAETFRVAAYNVENYIDAPTESRPEAKSPAAKAKIRESIHALRPDVLALEEMGSTNALLELQQALKNEGLDFPYWEYVAGADTNIHVAVLSRFPFAARRSHPDDSFLLSGRRFQVSRGILEVDVQVNPQYRFTLFAAHLKSKRPVPEADEAEQRFEEARVLREKIDARFAANPTASIVVLGDFNDTYNSKSTREIVGRDKFKLIDTRPAERNGDNQPNPHNPRYFPRNITWTHYYGVEDTYSRIDYLLLSPGMAHEWVRTNTFIPTIPNWGLGSDHRPIVAEFSVTDR